MNSTVPISDDPARQRVAAIVVAAGESSRMGSLKPLLSLAGVTALERSVTSFRDAGIDEVIVVLGHRAQELQPLAERCGARSVYNPNFHQGMYSSLVAGAQALPKWARGAFVQPADVPLVREATIRRLAAAFAAHPDGIIYPVYDEQRGHPPLIARRILNEAAHGKSGPLCDLLLAHKHDAVDVSVAGEAVHLDMDTPADFKMLRALARRREIPTTGECEALLAQQHVPESVVRHSRKVAEAAGRIADALFKGGLAMRADLARAGALLHDLAKGQPKHAEAGAAILRDLRMSAVADVMAAHTEMEFSGTIDERAIVYLADKPTLGDRLVTLNERFGPALERFRGKTDALAAARKRKAVAEQIAKAIEELLRLPVARPRVCAPCVFSASTPSESPKATPCICAKAVPSMVNSRQSSGAVRILTVRGAANAVLRHGRRCVAHPVERGCPFDCGLCEEHRQHTCCVVLDVTQRCNLACPVCFASAGGTAKPDPSADEIVGWCRKLIELGGPFNLHLSGGEPTVRRDLPEIIRRVRALGFSSIQLNTNGVRLALDGDYAHELKDAGLTCVFLQFDGVSDDVYQTIRGRPLLETKLEAIANCGRAQMGVVLVPTLAPAVRAVHFQPISYFGRYPAGRTDDDRSTFPEVIRHIEQQTEGMFKAQHFYPASGENPYCSFHGKFWLDAEKRVTPAPRPRASSCCGPAVEQPGLIQLGAPKPEPWEGVRRAQQFVAQHWSYPSAPETVEPRALGSIDISSFDQFLANKKMSSAFRGWPFRTCGILTWRGCASAFCTC